METNEPIDRVINAVLLARTQLEVALTALAELKNDPRWLAGPTPGARFWPQVLRQRDPRWATLRLGNETAGTTSTIGRYGCLVTSLAYLLNALAGEERFTPVSVNTALTAANGFSNGNRVVFKAVEELGKVRFVGIVPTPRPVSGPQFGEIDRRLAAGVPVIVKVDLSAEAGVQEHYVCLTEKDGDDYWIADPWHEDSDGDPAHPGQARLSRHYPPVTLPRRAEYAIEAIVLYDRKE